jgi:hypothetical protein
VRNALVTAIEIERAPDSSPIKLVHLADVVRHRHRVHLGSSFTDVIWKPNVAFAAVNLTYCLPAFGRWHPGMTGIGRPERPLNDWEIPFVGGTKVFQDHGRAFIATRSGRDINSFSCRVSQARLRDFRGGNGRGVNR